MKINPVFCGNNKYEVKRNNNQIATKINEQRMVDSFIKMAKIDTGSDEKVAEVKIPSTDCQKNLANVLKDELTSLGLKDVNIDEYSIVTATLEGNVENSPVVGLLAHMDTSSEAPTANVQPIIHNYDKGDIVLKEGTVIPECDLQKHSGKKIITSDGTTLLGADDKAGIAEILEAVRVFKENPDIKHPTIRIAFTPDEETGMGISKFDIKKFGADLAYTIDGDEPNVIEDESFNAFNPEITIKGKSVHTGFAKEGGMINAALIAAWIANKLPKGQTPQETDGRKGFFHVSSITGNVSETKINMLVRDHDIKKAKKRIEILKKIISKAEKKFGCEIEFNPKERYHNMKEFIDKFPEVKKFAIEGIKRSNLKPITKAIRGGTDGSQLSIKGLPTPNLGTGGANFHSKKEFVVIESMMKSVENIINIMNVWAENAPKIISKTLIR